MKGGKNAPRRIIKEEDTTAEAFQLIYAETQPVIAGTIPQRETSPPAPVNQPQRFENSPIGFSCTCVRHNDKSRVASDPKKHWIGLTQRF